MSADPATMMMGGMGAMGLGGLFGASGKKKVNEAEAQAMEYKSTVALTNARIARESALNETATGDAVGQVRLMKGAQDMSRAEATYSAGNIDISTGTPQNVFKDIGTMTALDTLTIRNTAARNAFNYYKQEANFTNDAELLKRGAASVRAGGDASYIGSLLSTGGSVAEKWGQYNLATSSSTTASAGGWADAGSVGAGAVGGEEVAAGGALVEGGAAMGEIAGVAEEVAPLLLALA